jgi:hypothetical protein
MTPNSNLWTDQHVLRQKLFISVLAHNPGNAELLELCEQWNVTPIYFGAWQYGSVNRLATIAELAKYLRGHES